MSTTHCSPGWDAPAAGQRSQPGPGGMAQVQKFRDALVGNPWLALHRPALGPWEYARSMR
jgi:hypothetical protein